MGGWENNWMFIPKLTMILFICPLLYAILKNNINNFSYSIALQIRQICETDEKFNNCSKVQLLDGMEL